MEKIRKVVAPAALPTNPVGIARSAGLAWLFMDRFHAPSWAWGCFWTVTGILFAAAFVIRWYEEEVDIFKS